MLDTPETPYPRMRTKSAQWRKRVLNACQTVAKAVSDTDGGAAHTVQLMMQDPKARAEAMDIALALAGPGGRHYVSTDDYQRVQAAVDVLRGYHGERL